MEAVAEAFLIVAHQGDLGLDNLVGKGAGIPA
jgi:hypothetical protein